MPGVWVKPHNTSRCCESGPPRAAPPKRLEGGGGKRQPPEDGRGATDIFVSPMGAAAPAQGGAPASRSGARVRRDGLHNAGPCVRGRQAQPTHAVAQVLA